MTVGMTRSFCSRVAAVRRRRSYGTIIFHAIAVAFSDADSCIRWPHAARIGVEARARRHGHADRPHPARLLDMDRAHGARHVRHNAGTVGVDDDRRLGRSTPAAALGDVGRDDDGDDAAIGLAARPALCRCTAHSRRCTGRPEDVRDGCGLRAGVGAVQRGCDRVAAGAVRPCWS